MWKSVLLSLQGFAAHVSQGQEASASPRSLLEMQMIRASIGLTESDPKLKRDSQIVRINVSERYKGNFLTAF